MGSEFDLVSGTFQLTVGGKALTCIQNGNAYSFGDDVKSDRFVIIYNEDDDSFTWTINENVSNFAPVQLSYKVKLTNSSTTAGTYEVPTNEYARLTPKDSNGVVGQTVEFDIPKVSYTIKSLYYNANGGTGTNGTAKPTDSPKTGDNSSLALWFVLLLASGGAITATTIYGRKNKRSVK